MDTTTPEIWQHFEALCAIPRVSHNEAGAREYVLRVAASVGAETQTDARGNVVVRVPATPGAPADPAKTVALQSHLDMVPAVADGVTHDFAHDPITTVREGDWLTTGGRTTLGADNGIGAAMMLAFLITPGLAHGPLELLFTVEEEIGLVGARELDPALVRATRMINLDNEDPHDILIGCAGGGGASIEWEPAVVAVADGAVAYQLRVYGLLGGHSGVEIHRHRANAAKLLGRLLAAVSSAGVDLQLASFAAGSVANKIPADGSAVFVTAPEQDSVIEAALTAADGDIRQEFGDDDPDFQFTIVGAERPARALTAGETTRYIAVLAELPHGAQTMSAAYNAVETSCNLAISRVDATVKPASARFAISCRSLVETGVPELQAKISAIASRYDLFTDLGEGYPCWEPKSDSALLDIARKTYETVYGHPANVTVVHAGVECGTIISRCPGLDAIAVGPLIDGAHTPRERVNIPSVETFWSYLVALVHDLQAD